jgi:hypothetical protein
LFIWLLCQTGISSRQQLLVFQLRQQQQRQGVLTRAKRGDVLLVAEGISKTHDGEKILFNNLTVSVL